MAPRVRGRLARGAPQRARVSGQLRHGRQPRDPRRGRRGAGGLPCSSRASGSNPRAATRARCSTTGARGAAGSRGLVIDGGVRGRQAPESALAFPVLDDDRVAWATRGVLPAASAGSPSSAMFRWTRRLDRRRRRRRDRRSPRSSRRRARGWADALPNGRSDDVRSSCEPGCTTIELLGTERPADRPATDLSALAGR